MEPSKITEALVKDLRKLSFAEPVTHVYNPLIYAKASHTEYLERYGSNKVDYVLLGMNPGPFGMVQTGVPFGEIEAVRDWMGIQKPVRRPKLEHPKRPIEGFDCSRREISGARLWGWAKERFLTPARFFRRFAVLNYCPLAFLEQSGRNRTPDKLPPAERASLVGCCDKALAKFIRFYEPKMVIGIGVYAHKRADQVLEAEGLNLATGRILHPSPASPVANRGWAAAAEKQLEALKVPLS